MKHLKIKIFGKVQGVWFRKSAKMKARDLGLTGYVKNEADGTVYSEVEGPDKEVDIFVEWCKEGSPLARVERVKTEIGPGAGFNKFEIKR